MEKSVSCMVLPVGDVSFLLPCTAVVEIFKASRGSGFDYEDPKTVFLSAGLSGDMLLCRPLIFPG